MFKAYIDGVCFYDDRLEQNTITGLKLKLEENKGGSFEFTLHPDNSWYFSFEKIVSTITVEQDGRLIFRGRVLDSEESFIKERKVTCEGEYAFFNDGIFYPLGSEPVEATSNDEEDKPGTKYTPIEIFTQIITDYNSQVPENRRFIVGSVSIPNSTEDMDFWNLEFKTSIDALDDLLEKCGGHLVFRHEESGIYIDWTDDYQLIDQSVAFGRNLLDLTQKIQADELVTAILPHGDSDENRNIPTNISHMQIPSSDVHMQMGIVPNAPDNSRDEQFGPYGIYLVNIPLYEKYGLIIEERAYDGYPADWKDQLIADVDGLTGLTNSIEVEAVDLAWLENVQFFELGKAVKVQSFQHGVNDEYHITKIDIDLQDPSSSKFTLGKTIKNFVEQIVDADRKPVDGQSIKVTGYEFAYAISNDGIVVPDDASFSDTYTPQQGKWLWTRVITKFNDGTSTKCYYPSYLSIDGKVFRIKADNTVVVRNDRSSSAQTITFTAEISGYPDAIPIWYVGSQKIGEGGSVSRSISYKNAEAFTVSLYNGTELMDTLNLVVVDKTGGAVYLGPCNEAIPTQTSDGLALIVGDYFLCSKNFDSYVAGNPYVFDGTRFVALTLNENATPNEYATIMGTCLDDALSSDTIENTKFMSWFRRLATKEAFIDSLVANEAFIKQLLVYNLSVGSGDQNSGFYMRIQDGNPPTIVAKFDGKVLWQIDAVSGKMYGNFAEVIQYLPYTFNDSLDASHPAVFDFFVPEGEIIWAKLRVSYQKYRNYAKVAISKGIIRSSSNLKWDLGAPDIIITTYRNITIPSSYHSHSYSYEAVNFDWEGNVSGSRKVYDTTGSAATGGGSFQIPNTFSIKANHSHEIDSTHGHDLELGIIEGSLPSNVTFAINNGDGFLIENVIADKDEKNINLTPNGFKSIRFKSSSLGRLQVQLILKMRIDTTIDEDSV